MDIKTLESFSLGDAIFFHDDLNKNLWDMNNQLRPEVKNQLLLIAKDFIEELGIKDLDVKDITVSGSNAAYTYTPHSDLDLHILVDMTKLPEDEVYRELFTAKKNLYNDSHDIKVHGVPIELYVQDTNEPVVSLGEYSILKDKWLRIPTKRRANFDQTVTKQKYKKLLDIIEKALKTKDLEKVNNIITTIKRYRKAGLDRGGEFGPENLAYKALRTQGYIDKLYDLRDKLHSIDLSIEENNKVIDEVFNTKPGKKNSAYWEHTGEDGSTLHFEASNGLEYRLDIIPMWMGADEARPWEFADVSDEQDDNGRYVEFSQVGTDWVKDVTGTGSSAEVFSIVVNGILQYVKKFKPPFLMFQAAEVNRRRLYNAMLQRLLPLMPNYKVIGPKADGMYFVYDSRVIKPLTTTVKEVVNPDIVSKKYFIEPTKNVRMGDFEFNARTFTGGLADPNARGLQIRAYDPKYTKGYNMIGNADFIVKKDKKGNQWLESDDTTVADGYQGLGVAKMMYAFAKSLGNDIKPSPYQSQKGREMWNKWGKDAKHLVGEQDVTEAFDQPYKLKWEKGDFGDVDAYAKLPDGNYLSIMFNKGYNQDNEEAWNVEFFRNNSQEVTGEGDAQRVFATVLGAIQTFIKKYKPNRVIFAASKDVEPGQNSQSRANLYDRLVQRYAKAWGFKAFRADTGNKVIYELNRINKAVAEGFDNIPTTLYHATYRPLLKSIKQYGLGGDRAQAKWEDSELGVVYLALDKNVAESYAETSDVVPDEWLDEIVILKISTNGLDTTKFHLDRNVQDNEGDTLEYHGIIPVSNIKMIKQGVAEASGYIPSESEKNDPRFKTALTVDVHPDSIKKNAKAFNSKVSRAGIPPTLKANGKF